MWFLQQGIAINHPKAMTLRKITPRPRNSPYWQSRQSLILPRYVETTRFSASRERTQ